MSKPVFEDLFKFEGRRNRKSYLLIQLATWGATVAGLLLGMFGFATAIQEGSFATFIGWLLMITAGIIVIGAIAAAWITAAQRTRDIGWPGWVCLAILIPYVGFVAALVILIAPGETREPNRYGPSLIVGQSQS